MNWQSIAKIYFKVNLIQIHSLKGINSGDCDKIGHFLFFATQFWDENELRIMVNAENRLNR